MKRNDEQKSLLERRISSITEYKQTFGTVAGKKVLYDLMMSNYVMGSTFVKGSPEETFFREGARNAVLRILTIMDTDMERLKAMFNERGEG